MKLKQAIKEVDEMSNAYPGQRFLLMAVTIAFILFILWSVGGAFQPEHANRPTPTYETYFNYTLDGTREACTSTGCIPVDGYRETYPAPPCGAPIVLPCAAATQAR